MRITRFLKNERGDASLFLAVLLIILVSLIIMVLTNALTQFLVLTREQEHALQNQQYAELAVHHGRWLLDGAHIRSVIKPQDPLNATYIDPAFGIDLDGDGTDEATAVLTITYNDPTAGGYDPNYNYTITAAVGNTSASARYSGGFLIWWD